MLQIYFNINENGGKSLRSTTLLITAASALKLNISAVNENKAVRDALSFSLLLNLFYCRCNGTNTLP